MREKKYFFLSLCSICSSLICEVRIEVEELCFGVLISVCCNFSSRNGDKEERESDERDKGRGKIVDLSN